MTASRRFARPLVLALASAGIAVSLGKAHAQEPGSPKLSPGSPVGDPQALSVGVPVRIQDALVTPFGEAIFQTVGTNTYVDRRGSGLSSPLSETLKLGVAPGLGLNLGIAQNFGDSGHSGVTVTPSFQYVFNKSQGYIPGFSVEGAYTPRPGTGQSGGTWGFSAQATKNLGPTDQSPRLHFNVEWNKDNDQTNRLRPQTLGYGVGYSMLMSERAALVTDIFYSQTAARRDSQTFVDAGVSYILTPRLSLSGGGGVGVDRSTPAFRVFFSLSTSFRFLN